MGLPDLINYPGWLAELITETNLGTAVLPDEPKAFAEELYKLSLDRPRLEKAGSNARNLAERKFGRNELANRFVDYLESFLKKSKGLI